MAMNINTIIAAIKSSKTPANLKKGLIKKYGHLLQGTKLPMSALATTVRTNPSKHVKSGSIRNKHTERHIKARDAADRYTKAYSKKYPDLTNEELDAIWSSHYHEMMKIRTNPAKKKKSFDGNFGKTYIGNPVKRKHNTSSADVYVSRVGKTWYVDYPAKQYTGTFADTPKGRANLKAFLKPAVSIGLSIAWSK